MNLFTSYDSSLYSYFMLFAVYPYIILEVIQLFIVGAFAAVDHYASPAWLKLNKIQSYKIDKQDASYWSRYRRSTFWALMNQAFISTTMMTLGSIAYWYVSCPYTWESFPSLTQCIYQIAIILLVEEMGFYYGHRALHLSPYLFRRIHAQHHEWDAPVSITAVYCHPLEHILVNLTPIIAGPMFCRAHLYIIWAWFAAATINTCLVHSGYNWWWCSALRHDQHHSATKCNYGVLGLCDWFHQTRWEDWIRQRQTAHTQQEQPPSPTLDLNRDKTE